jgi:long-chain acyl-CoA synthetase
VTLDMSRVREITSAGDPVAAVLDAHEHGELIALQTSGTTSRPRSVVRTTASWVDSFPHVSRLTGIDRHARVWVPGPMAATMNLFAAVHARTVGATLVHSPEDATHAHLTPAALLTALSGGGHLQGVHVVVAGDRLTREAAARAEGRGARTSHYYGAAELSFVAWGSHEEDLRPFPGVEVQIRDQAIWVRSPYLCLAYRGGAHGPVTVDDRGFATVGDRGSFERGLLTVTGRGTELVLTGGASVLVADVEQALRTAIGSDVVVVGVPHPRLGQVVGAVVTDAAARAPLRAVARAALASAQQPRLWFSVASFPLTASGKVDRAALAALAAAGRLTTVTPLSRSGS